MAENIEIVKYPGDGNKGQKGSDRGTVRKQKC